MDNRFWFPVKNWVEVGTTIFGPNPLKVIFDYYFTQLIFGGFDVVKLRVHAKKQKTSSEGTSYVRDSTHIAWQTNVMNVFLMTTRGAPVFNWLLLGIGEDEIQKQVYSCMDYFTCKKMYKILFLYVFTRFEHNVMKISEPDVQVSLGSF